MNLSKIIDNFNSYQISKIKSLQWLYRQRSHFFDSEEKKRITVEDTENTAEQKAETKTEEVKYEFDRSFHAKIATLFARDNKFALRTDDGIVLEYFENEAAAALV